MKIPTYRALLAPLAALLLPLSPSAHAEHVGHAPHAAGILCFDGANRGGKVQIKLRAHVNTGGNGKLIHEYPQLGYYSRQVCKRLSDIDIAVGQVVDVHHNPQSYKKSIAFRPCNGGDGRYTIKNDGSNKHIFAQVGGSTYSNSNCTIKTDWKLPGHAHHLVQHKGEDRHPGGPARKVGILCFDGANRGSNVKIQLHRTNADYKSNAHVAYDSPWLAYHTQQLCVRLSDLKIPTGLPLEVHHYAYSHRGQSSRRPCTGGLGKYLIVNDNSNRHVFAQVGGRSMWDSNCTMRSDWKLPGHAHNLVRGVAHTERPGGPAYLRGILCFDGANRGSSVQIRLKKVGTNDTVYGYPWLGYYTGQVCERLSEIGVGDGEVVEVHHYAKSSGDALRPCTGGAGRYLIKNDNSNKHVFAQVGGRSIWDSNCTMKPDWKLPGHARHLLK